MNLLFVTGYEFETPIPMITREGVKPLPAHRLPHAGCAHGLLLRRHRHHARDGHAPDRHRLAISVCRWLDANKQLLRRRQDLQGDAAEGHPGGELLVVHALRQPDALDARHAAALSARRQPELSVARRRSRTPTAPRRSTSARPSLRGSNGATGFRPMPERAWFTILRLYSPLEPFFTKSGGRARSNWFNEASPPVMCGQRRHPQIGDEVIELAMKNRYARQEAINVRVMA